MTLQAL